MFLLRSKASGAYRGAEGFGVDRRKPHFSLFAAKFDSEEAARAFGEKHHPGGSWVVEKASPAFIAAITKRRRKTNFVDPDYYSLYAD